MLAYVLLMLTRMKDSSVITSPVLRKREEQRGINMVDLMMWLVIAAMILASAIQGIAYYQQSAFIYQLKSAVDVASSRVMALATNDGKVDPEDLDTVVAEENAKTPDDGITLTVETLSYSASAPQDNEYGIARASFITAATVVADGETAYIRGSHDGASKSDVVFFFEDTASTKTGMHVVPKNGVDDGSGSEGGGGSTTEPTAPAEDPNKDTDGDGTPDSEDATPNGPDKDADGIPDATDPDIDGDGIPNETDEDADGDGVPDDYVPGGAITEPDGTPYPYMGSFSWARINDSGNSVWAVFNAPTNVGSKKVSVHFIGTCKPTDGAEYEVNRLNGYTTTSTTTAFGVGFTCGTDKLIKYVIKPLTQEAMASGEIANPEYAGNDPYRNTASGGLRWSEFDGHKVLGTMGTAYVLTDARTINSHIDFISEPYVRAISVDLKFTCVRPDRSTYTGNILVNYSNTAGQTGKNYQNSVVCTSGDVISDFSFAPVKSLRNVTNANIFDGYSVDGNFSWTEADGYNTLGDLAVLTRSFVNNGGNQLTLNYDYKSHPYARKMAVQVENTCVRVDKTTYTKNTLQYVTTTANTTGVAFDHPILCASGEVISAYKIGPVTSMRDAATPIGFNGFTTTGTKTWTEADGYYTDNDLAVLSRNFVNNGGNVLTINYDHKSAPYARELSLEVKNTCVRPDKSTYEKHTLRVVKTTANTTGVAYIHPTLCAAGEVISAYQITPVTALSKLEAPSVFTGFSATGSTSWTEADGYYNENSLAVYSSSYVRDNGNQLTVLFDHKAFASSRKMTFELKNTCLKTDGTSYSKHTLQHVTTTAGTTGVAYVHPIVCATGEKVSAYEVAPVTALSKVTAPSGFSGFSTVGGYKWAG